MGTTFTEWLQARSRNGRRKSLSDATLRQKASNMSTLSGRACEMFGIQNQEQALAELLTCRESVEALFDSLTLSHKAGSVRNIYFAAKDFERYAKAQRWATSFALDDADCPLSDPQANVVCFTPGELQALDIGSRMKGLRWHLLVMLLIHTGRRISDVLNITYADIKLTDEVPHIVIPKSKGSDKTQYAPLNQALLAILTPENLATLQSTEQQGQYVTSRSSDVYLFPFTYTNMLARWTAMLTALEIPYRSPHKLRHTFATRLIAKGAPITGVSRLLGHANVAVTDKYYSHINALSYAPLLD